MPRVRVGSAPQQQSPLPLPSLPWLSSRTVPHTNHPSICSTPFAGHYVIIVSSGAIGVGCQRLGLSTRPSKIAQKQALAAIGQVHLMRYYEDILTALGLVRKTWGETLLCTIGDSSTAEKLAGSVLFGPCVCSTSMLLAHRTRWWGPGQAK